MNVQACFILNVQVQSEVLCLCKYVGSMCINGERTEDNH